MTRSLHIFDVQGDMMNATQTSWNKRSRLGLGARQHGRKRSTQITATSLAQMLPELEFCLC
ncbi:hypothetical protein ACE1CB_12410 [Aerosakkonema sp. BLCC-F2]